MEAFTSRETISDFPVYKLSVVYRFYFRVFRVLTGPILTVSYFWGLG